MSTLASPAPSAGALITVRAALRLPALRVGSPELLAGRRHLDRPIRWVHVAEVANIATLLKGGELLLSTGAGIGRSAAQQRRYLEGLAEREVAALVVELGQHFTAIPGAMITHAEELGLPLIALRREIAFVEVTEAVHSVIVSRQYAALRRGEEIHRRFTELMIDGAGIPEILGALAETIANPVVLEQAGPRMLYHATHRAATGEVLAAWEALRGDVRPDELATVEAPVPATGGTSWGRLIALGLDSPLDEFARVGVERGAELVALALLRGHQEDVLAARERGNFLTELAAGRLAPADAALRAETLGFHRRAGSLLMPLAVAGAAAPGQRPVLGLALAGAWEALVAEMRSRKIPVLVGTSGGVGVGGVGGGVGPGGGAGLGGAGLGGLGGLGSGAGGGGGGGDLHILLGLTAASRRRELIETAVQTIRTALARQGETTVPAIAAGRAVAGWADLPGALREAADTAALACHGPARDWHDAAAPDVDRLLWRLRGNADLRAFVEQRLEALLEHDRRRSAKLLPTLEALLEHEGRKAETARALHLERQSLYHRIGRIETLLGVDLRDPSVRLGLHLALRARLHMGRGG